MEIIAGLFHGVTSLGWQELVMYVIGLILIYLAIAKEYEPTMLLPIGFGAILVNLPFGVVWGTYDDAGFLQLLYNVGIFTELFPIFIFIAIGAMIDFGQLLRMPRMIFFGAAAQLGIFLTVLVALAIGRMYPELGIGIHQAAAIGILGTADGPTSIVVARQFAPELLAPITLAAYSYMALVPIIQPPVIRALTTKKERLIRMDASETHVSRKALILFPVTVTLISGIFAPESAPLVGALMFGNLIRVCGVLERLSRSAQNELANIVTILLGITVGAMMRADEFLRPVTLLIMVLGFLAFVFDTAGGVLFAKCMNLFSKRKVNPMIGASGISAFPMSARVVHKMAREEDPSNFILMQSVSANVSGQLGSVVAGGLILHLVPALLGS